MRILFFNEIPDPGVGSSVRLTFELCRALRALGHETAVVSTVRNPQEASPTEIDDTLVFRLHSDYPVRWRPWVSLHNRRIDQPLAATLAEWRPDVVHAQLIHTHLGYHSLTQARRAGAGVVFTAHDVMTFCYQKLTCFHGGEKHGGKLFDIQARASKCIPCQRFRFRPGRNRSIREVLGEDVNRMTVVSDALGELLTANGLRVDRTLHNALDFGGALPEPDAVRAFREQHGLAEARVIAIGGRLHSQKGMGKALEMLAILKNEFADVRLLVMGQREIYDQEFAPQAEALGVGERVVPTGWLEGQELDLAYAAVDVLITPSLCFDTFGMVNLEAMRHAKPVVATTFGGSREVLEEGVTGYLANPFDVPLFAERIAQLLRDPQLCLRMGRAGRARLEQRFGIERLAAECLEEYTLARAGG